MKKLIKAILSLICSLSVGMGICFLWDDQGVEATTEKEVEAGSFTGGNGLKVMNWFFLRNMIKCSNN